MTKPDLLASPVRRHPVADLHLAIGDDHPVDQEFDEGPSLLECRLGQPSPHSPAEIRDGAGEPGKLVLPIRLRFEPSRLPLELPLAILEVTPAPPIFVEPHDPSEIGLGQPLELLPQARQSTS
jgi:hypothetical protein